MVLPDGACVCVSECVCVCALMDFEFYSYLFVRICFTLTYINELSVRGCLCVFSVDARSLPTSSGDSQKDAKLLSTVNISWGSNTKPRQTRWDRLSGMITAHSSSNLSLTSARPVCWCACSRTTPQIKVFSQHPCSECSVCVCASVWLYNWDELWKRKSIVFHVLCNISV